MAADPIIGLSELLDGDTHAYLRQNNRNLVMARLSAVPYVIDSGLTYPAGAVNRGDMWIVNATATSHWTGRSDLDIAIALSDDPASPGGWFFLTPTATMAGIRVWIAASTGGATITGHAVWNGSAWAAV